MSKPKQYRKKPVAVEAMQVGVDTFKSIIEWSGARPVKSGNAIAWLIIPTLEGEMKADIGDFIIKGIQGEFYPCKPDIFEATYEPVEAKDGE